jgi:hypothetical protein
LNADTRESEKTTQGPIFWRQGRTPPRPVTATFSVDSRDNEESTNQKKASIKEASGSLNRNRIGTCLDAKYFLHSTEHIEIKAEDGKHQA